MKQTTTVLIGLVVVFVGVLVYASAYRVFETQQVIITQFGKPVGEPITKAGLRFKTPFIQTVNYIDRRILAWDGPATQMATRDKTYIVVDTFARWRIKDPLIYFETLRDDASAVSRLNAILGSETRNAIANHDLIEVIRTTKDRVPVVDESLAEEGQTVVSFEPINIGRGGIEQQIMDTAKGKLEAFGIELLDIKIKRVNYNNQVLKDIYERMISERQRIAQLYRSQGQGEAARILGETDRDLKKIESEAYKEVQTIQGDADAKAAEIYASAYNQSPEAAEFYNFIKTMEVYQQILGEDTTLMLSTDSDLFEFFKGIDPKNIDSEASNPQGNQQRPAFLPNN